MISLILFFFFFFNDTATTEIYTLSLHDALPISLSCRTRSTASPSTTSSPRPRLRRTSRATGRLRHRRRSEEHTSELQSRQYLVCRLLLEKKKKNINTYRSNLYTYIYG